MRLERMHDCFRSRIGIYDHVDVCGSDMRRNQRPITVKANLLNGLEYNLAPVCIENIAMVAQSVSLGGQAYRVRRNESAPRLIVVSIH